MRRMLGMFSALVVLMLMLYAFGEAKDRSASKKRTVTQNLQLFMEHLAIPEDSIIVLGEKKDGHAVLIKCVWINGRSEFLERISALDLRKCNSVVTAVGHGRTSAVKEWRKRPSFNMTRQQSFIGEIYEIDFDRFPAITFFPPLPLKFWKASSWKRVTNYFGHFAEVFVHKVVPGAVTNQEGIYNGLTRRFAK